MVRFSAVLFALLTLAACNRGTQSNEAVRQAVIDHLSKANFNVSAMTVTITSVQFKGNQADAVVSIAPKQGGAGSGMTMPYHLEQQGSQWVVVKRQEAGGNPHGMGTMPVAPAAPDAPNPHGGAPGGPSQMPSPSDLPPVKK
jgi:hypothetical protein